MKHKILDLFSGIGGFSYGFEMANLGETIAFVEKDQFCQKVLRKHWENVPIIDDIRKVNGKDFGAATIISGGFPCQPFSVAGKRKGKEDDRYLWDETIRVVAECKPRWFIGENVDGIVNISNGTILRQIQEDLEKEGFQVQCLVIPASGVGAWHQRKRVWIIGYNVSYTNHNGHKRGQSETCNKINARENNTSIWRESASNISGSSDDRGDKTKSRIDEDISRSYNGNEEKSTTAERLCYLSEKSNECDTIKQTSADKENNNRTLVQKRQMFQLSESRGLGNNQTSSERNQIRSRDDNVISDRMDTNNVSNAECLGFSERSSIRGLHKKESKDSNNFSNKSKTRTEKRNVSNSISKGLENDVIQSDNKQTTKTKINSDRSFEKQQTWWQTQSELCGVPDGVSYELHSDRANRIKALGNSIVPQIAQLIGESILIAEEDDTKQTL